ncbi:MAG TPA: hypothetical protein DFI00_02355 [Rhodospirillaceae bacterium]|nr:hypothetical protein [Alphaproteobacteria bacterium]OUT39629.1 MAG: hypothetical protein CBB62_14805 [Micavibrio sp. TMED2]HCI46115.1 hypothetical protein [Rhodospirillaceae bacterium]MAS49022.1 hypothetical protein [Alphaproteobacteria bacterium]MAX97376.1 hypothetical protein [Alphaproteobacteria bacterium]|tara:strand:- start:32359 stop:33054 length:696 start_codon:yes stop_codon:yes gene_type:complete
MLFLAASFLILQNAGAYQQSTLKPSSFEKPYESASYAKGNEFGMMISGVSRMIAQYQVEPTYAARGEFVAEFDDGSNPAASQWDLDWVSFGDFLDTSAYAIAEGLTRTSFYPPLFVPSENYGIRLLEKIDAAGNTTGEVGAMIAWLDMTTLTTTQLDRDSLRQGLSDIFQGSANIGINSGGRFTTRGYQAAELVMNGASFGLLPGFVPNGSVVYIRCYGELDASAADVCDG